MVESLEEWCFFHTKTFYKPPLAGEHFLPRFQRCPPLSEWHCPQAQRGHSRDQRPDCKQVCIATGCLASNPYPIYARIRRQAPVLWSERWNCWALSRHDDVVAALKDVDHFSPFSTVAGKTLSVYAGWRSF